MSEHEHDRSGEETQRPESRYSCPTCESPLEFRNDHYRCDNCHRSWGLVHIENVHEKRVML